MAHRPHCLDLTLSASRSAARVAGQPTFGSVWRVRNDAQYGGPPEWHPEPESDTHPVIVLEEAEPDVLAARPVLQAAPRTTRPQAASPLAIYLNPGMAPGLDAGWILIRYAMPIDIAAFDGFRRRAFVCNLPPGVLERIRAVKRYAKLPF